MNGVTILQGDVREVLKTLPDESVNCVVTSPPYWGLRDYGVEGQIGMEETLQGYLAEMVVVFREIWRVLRPDGTNWLNLGDSYNSGNKGNSGEMNPSYKQATNAGSLATRRGEKLGAQRNGGAKDLCKPKDLCGIPWRVAFALQADGWYLRSDIIWHKPNPMPESVTDRPTKAHEYIFLMSKSERYYYNAEAVLEDAVADHLAGNNNHKGAAAYSNGDEKHRTKVGLVAYAQKWKKQGFAGHSGDHNADGSLIGTPGKRNKRSVWTVPIQPTPEAHFATFPEDLVKPCILAGCPAGGTVLDPFFGSGTTGLVARANGCKCIGIELNPDYIKIAERRLSQEVLQF